MKNLIFSLCIALFSFSCVSQKIRNPAAEQFLTAGDVFFDRASITDKVTLIETIEALIPKEARYQRLGMFLESPQVEFRGCIMYLEGFGDSIMNHYPMFNKLRQQGYRIIGFDYLGQGGSSGSMNQMSIGQIAQQARFVWDHYANRKDPNFNRSCKGSKRRVLAWSTGGLAAYELAREKWSNASVFINPAIAPRLCVGETSKNCASNVWTNEVVTFNTLTRNKFEVTDDPHLEPVRPNSIRETLGFAADLTLSAASARNWKIEGNQRLMFLLSGKNDAYVDTEAVVKVLDHKVVPVYRVYQYENAYHELDNELPEDADDVHKRIIEFFNEED